jgi:tRNA threonylcarbamoyladenosine biosynthesis protein TsaB
MATAKGLAFAAGKPLWAVSSLAALALAAGEPQNHDDDHHRDLVRALVVPILDARRGEIFAGFYRLDGGATAVAEEQVLAPDALGPALAAALEHSQCERAVLAGDGLDVYADAIDGSLAATIHGSRGRSLAEVARRAKGAASTPPAAAVARLSLDGEHEDILISGAPTYIRLSEAEIKYPQGNPGGTFARRR